MGQWDSSLEASICLPTQGLLHGNDLPWKDLRSSRIHWKDSSCSRKPGWDPCPTKDPRSGLCWCCVTRQGSKWPGPHPGICLPSSWSSVEKDNYRHNLRFRLLVGSNLFTFFSSCGKMESRLQWLTQSWLNMAQFCVLRCKVDIKCSWNREEAVVIRWKRIIFNNPYKHVARMWSQ